MSPTRPASRARRAGVALALAVLGLFAVTDRVGATESASQPPVAPARESDIIYPRQAAPADAPALPTKPGGGNGTILLLALAAAAAGGWLLWRQRHAVAGRASSPRLLAIAESRPLGNRQYLVVADYDGRKFLLGVCPGRIEMLAPLDSGNKDGAA